MRDQFRRVAELRRELTRCEWNLNRANFAHIPAMQNDYSNEWAGHHEYFAGYRAHILATLRYALTTATTMIDQGIGL